MYNGCNKNIEQAKHLEKYILDRKVKKKHLMFFEKLSVDAKIENFPTLLGGWMVGNFKISTKKVRLVTHLLQSLFEAKLLIKVV